MALSARYLLAGLLNMINTAAGFLLYIAKHSHISVLFNGYHSNHNDESKQIPHCAGVCNFK